MFSLLTIALLIGVPSAATDASPGKKDNAPPKIQLKEPPVDLSGYYTCRGEEASGKKYAGIVTLTKKGDVYLISWVIGSGVPFSGIAIRQGDMLAASWALPTDKGIVRGVNLYRVEAGPNGPRLPGRWASVPGPGVQQAETLTFLKKLDAEEE